MVVKFFGNKKGGSTASVDYLLNEREEAKTARTLQGDPELTKSLIRSIERKQKVCVGCLSFEETNIPEADKYKLMAEFEQTLLPNMQGQYNILWVEHTDKGRLELNFVIPKVELDTGKRLSPYYHQADMTRMGAFQQVHNLENNWSNPKDPDKARSIDTQPKQINLSRDYEQLNESLHNLVKDGAIQNRDQLIETLRNAQIEVTRTSKESISVKLPESLKARKLKGDIYAEQFTSPESLRAISDGAKEAVREFNQRDTHTELRRAKQELDKHIQFKAEQLRKQYPKRAIQEHTKDNQNKELDNHILDRTRKFEHSNTSDMVSKAEQGRDSRTNGDKDTIQRSREPQSDTREQELTSSKRDIPKQNQRVTSREQEPQSVEHTREYETNGQRGEIYQDEARLPRRRVELQMGNDKGITNGNRIRTDATRRAREREEAQQFSLTGVKEQPSGVYKRVAKNFSSIRERSKEKHTELRADTQRGTSEEQGIIRELHAERSGGISSIKERFDEVINYAKEFIRAKAQQVYKALQEMKAKEAKAQEILKTLKEEKPKEQEQTRSRGHSLSR